MPGEEFAISFVYDIGQGLYHKLRKGRDHRQAVHDAAETVAERTPGIEENDLIDIFSYDLDGDIIKTATADEMISTLAESLMIRANTPEDVDFATTIEQFLQEVEKNLISQGRPEEGIQVLYEYVRESTILAEEISEEIEQLYEQYHDDLTLLSNRCNRMVPDEERYQIPGLNEHIERPVASEIQSYVDSEENVILTGPAGVGKSGVLTERYYTWDQDSTVYFFDAREFGHLDSMGDLQSELGIRNSLRSVFERIGEQVGGCTVIIDQLDNIRTEDVAIVFENLLLDLAEVETVNVVCACRDWDLKQREYQRLRDSSQFNQLRLEPLKEDEVERILSELGLDASSHHRTLVELCQSLLNLSLLADVLSQDMEVDLDSITREIALWDAYKESLEQEGSRPHGRVPRSWDESPVERAKGHSRTSLQNSTTTFRIDERDPGDQRLVSRGTIEPDWKQRYRFRHDQLQSYFYAVDAIQEDFNISDVLQDDIDERIAADVFEWMLRFYLDDTSRSTSFIRDSLGSETELGFYARSIIADTAESLGPDMLGTEAAIAVIESVHTDRKLALEFYRNIDTSTWARFLVEEELLPDLGYPAANHVAQRVEDDQEIVIEGMNTYTSIKIEELHPYLSTIDELDPENLAIVGQLVVDWIQDMSPQDIKRIQTDLNKLIGGLLDSSRSKETIELVSVMVEPINHETEEREIGDYTSYKTELESRVEPWALQKLFEEHSEEMVEVCGEAIFNKIEGHFRTCLKIMSEGHEGDVRPKAIMSGMYAFGSINPTRLEVLLLQSVKDILTNLLAIQPETGTEILREYLREGGVFRQIATGIVAKNPNQATDLVEEILTNPENYEDGEITTGFINLLGSGFEYLPDEDRQFVFDRIEAGPDKERLRRRASSREVESQLEVEERVSEAIEIWKLKRLYQIRDHLSGVDKDRIEELIDKYGEVQFSAGSGYHLPFFEEDGDEDSTVPIESLDVDEFIVVCSEYAKQGVSEDDVVKGDRAELSREIRERILSEQSEYIPRLPEIVETKDDRFAERAFSAVEYLITGTDQQDKEIDNWDAVIQATSIFCDQDSIEDYWGQDCRRQFAQMVHTIIGHKRSTLEINDYQDTLSGVLLKLLSDQDPRPRESSVSGVGRGPSTPRVTGVRASGVIATVHFFRTLSVDLDDITTENQDLWDQLENLTTDAAFEVRTAFGRGLYSLYIMNREFVQYNLDSLFPEGEDDCDIPRFISTWKGYMTKNLISDELFDCLKPKYSRAIVLHREYHIDSSEQNLEHKLSTDLTEILTIDREHDQTFENICSHLAVSYVRSYISFDDPLINSIFEITTDDLSSEDPIPADVYFARSFADVLSNTDDRELEKECWDRTIEFWKRRIKNEDGAVEKHFREYARVLNDAPPSASICEVSFQLKRSATSFTNTFSFTRVLEFLADETGSTTDPDVLDEAIEVLSELIDHSDLSYRLPAADERWTVVKAAAAHGNFLAIDVAEQFFEAGEPEYKRLIDQHKKD